MDKKFELARIAYDNAFAKYSKFQVGAVVVLKNGEYILGSNVENASYGATICAERNAVFAAYSNGYRKEQIKALAIVSDGDRIAAPCGICRQVLCELVGQTMPIYLSNGSDEMVTCIEQLLPMQFGLEDVIR
jgi:cytidine deaminase